MKNSKNTKFAFIFVALSERVNLMNLDAYFRAEIKATKIEGEGSIFEEEIARLENRLREAEMELEENRSRKEQVSRLGLPNADLRKDSLTGEAEHAKEITELKKSYEAQIDKLNVQREVTTDMLCLFPHAFLHTMPIYPKCVHSDQTNLLPRLQFNCIL